MENTIIQSISLLITVIGFFLTYFFTKNPKLRFFYGAVTEIPIPYRPSNIYENNNNESTDSHTAITVEHPAKPKENLIVRSHTVVITNQGNATAHNVRVGHFILPAHTVYPPMNVPFDEKSPKNEILIPTLSPGENIIVSYLYDDKLHVSRVNAYIKCDEGVAEIANLQHVSVKSPFLKNAQAVINFIGILTVIYCVIKFGICLYKTCTALL